MSWWLSSRKKGYESVKPMGVAILDTITVALAVSNYGIYVDGYDFNIV